MIEKTIHYIWLGTKEVPERYSAYIESWRKLHPDWEIKRWNQDNFDCNCNSWIKTAIEQRKWSLASDVMRIYILLNHGGVYLDTDMELIKPLDDLVAENDFFIGYETDLWFGTAILAAKKGHRVMLEALQRYLVPIRKIDNHSNMLTVLNFAASVKRLYNIKLDGKTKELDDNGKLFSRDYFFPKHYIIRKAIIYENTITIHHYSSAWFSKGKRIGIYVAKVVVLIMGKKLFSNLFERLARVFMLSALDKEYKRNLKFFNKAGS